MNALSPEAERWLEELAQHLAPLGEAARRDTVAEIRSHLEERAAQGAADPLAPFGRAADYAALFLRERALAGALQRGTPWALGRALAAGAGRLAWWYVVVALGLVQLLGAAFVGLAALKLLRPDRVGVFLHGAELTLGGRFGDDAPPGTELLGWWGVPVFLAAGLCAIGVASLVLRGLAQWRLERLRPALPR